jgi:hypothetical protein
MHYDKSGNNRVLDYIMTESEYGGIGLSTVVVLERYVIFKTKFNGCVQHEVKLLIPIC